MPFVQHPAVLLTSSPTTPSWLSDYLPTHLPGSLGIVDEGISSYTSITISLHIYIYICYMRYNIYIYTKMHIIHLNEKYLAQEFNPLAVPCGSPTQHVLYKCPKPRLWSGTLWKNWLKLGIDVKKQRWINKHGKIDRYDPTYVKYIIYVYIFICIDMMCVCVCFRLRYICHNKHQVQNVQNWFAHVIMLQHLDMLLGNHTDLGALCRW